MKTSDLIEEENRILSREKQYRRGRIAYGVFGALSLMPVLFYGPEALEALTLIQFFPFLIGILCIGEALIYQSKLLHLESIRHYRSLLGSAHR